MTGSEELFEHFRFEVDKGQTPMRIDKYMSTHMEDTSRSRVQQAFKEGYVRVGDELVKPNYIVRPGDVIRFVMPYNIEACQQASTQTEVPNLLPPIFARSWTGCIWSNLFLPKGILMTMPLWSVSSNT